MQVVPMRGTNVAMRKIGLRFAGIAAGLMLGGCASTVSTPLPDLPSPRASTSLTQQQQHQAVDELTRAGATHERQAEEQIENSR